MDDKIVEDQGKASRAQQQDPLNDKLTQVTSDHLTSGRRGSQKTKSAIITAIFIFLITLAIGSGVYVGWQRVTQLLSQQQREITLVQQKLGQANDTIDSQAKELLNQREDLQHQWQQLQQQRAALQTLQSKDSEHDQQWILKEAEYLTRLANFSLNFQQNIPVTIELLTAADRQIASLNNPIFENLRKNLSDEITSLEAVTVPDIEGMLLKITSLSEQVPELEEFLTLNGQQKADDTHVNSAEEMKTTAKVHSSWRQGLSKTWGKIRSIVVIRSNKNPSKQVWTPSQRAYYDEHLQLLLNQAQWALLYRKQKLYDTSLRQANEWLLKYYDNESKKSVAMSDKLQQLAKVNIAPKLPDISHALTSIMSVEKQIAQQTRLNPHFDTQQGKEAQ